MGERDPLLRFGGLLCLGEWERLLGDAEVRRTGDLDDCETFRFGDGDCFFCGE